MTAPASTSTASTGGGLSEPDRAIATAPARATRLDSVLSASDRRTAATRGVRSIGPSLDALKEDASARFARNARPAQAPVRRLWLARRRRCRTAMVAADSRPAREWFRRLVADARRTRGTFRPTRSARRPRALRADATPYRSHPSAEGAALRRRPPRPGR